MSYLVSADYEEDNIVITHSSSFGVYINKSFSGCLADFESLKDISINIFLAAKKKLEHIISNTPEEKRSNSRFNNRVTLVKLINSLVAYRGTNNLFRGARDILSSLQIMEHEGEATIVARMGFTDVMVKENDYLVVHFKHGEYANFKTDDITLCVHDVVKTWYARTNPENKG